MSEMEKFDVMIVGAGPAGSSAAIRLMQENPELNVALIDRGRPIGSKNLSGGVLWGNELARIIPEWWKEAPIERKIVKKKFGFLTREDGFVMEFFYPDWVRDDAPPNAVSVLFSGFVNWLSRKAEKVGAQVFDGIRVDDVLRDKKGRIIGILQNGDEFKSDVVILADGVNSRLSLAAGLRKEMKREHYGVGVKEVLRVPSDVIEERFNVNHHEGVASEFALAELPKDVHGGGFLYTNRETLSIGVVIHAETLNDPDFPSYKVLEYFKRHPYIQPLIKDAEIAEYSARLVPEGGYHMLSRLYDDGVLVVGDAAGFVFVNGLVIQGINYAITSGILAADTIIEARKQEEFTKRTLQLYEGKLKQSYVLKNFKSFKNIHKIAKNPRLYNEYARIVTGAFKDMMTETGEPKQKSWKIFNRRRRDEKVSIFRLMMDGLAFRNL